MPGETTDQYRRKRDRDSESVVTTLVSLRKTDELGPCVSTAKFQTIFAYPGSLKSANSSGGMPRNTDLRQKPRWVLGSRALRTHEELAPSEDGPHDTGALKVQFAVPEIVEGSLQLGGVLLRQLGESADEVTQVLDQFRRETYARLAEMTPSGGQSLAR